MDNIRKIIVVSIFVLGTACVLHAQKLDTTFARSFCYQALDYLKKQDSVDFVNLWSPDDRMLASQKIDFTKERVKTMYRYIREFLDTVLENNVPIDRIEVERRNIKDDTSQYYGYFGLYTVWMWFKYNKNSIRGVGFHMDYINGRWVCCCWDPDTSEPDPYDVPANPLYPHLH